ncbi:MAG TPA: hypothetical protein VI957_01170 [Candidatus Paceibacterota bacterium]
MSERDRELLRSTGLEVAEVAAMIGRSRQALYTGFSKKKSYFNFAQAGSLILLLKATGKAPERIRAVEDCIEKVFPPEESEIVIPRFRNHRRLVERAKKATSVAFGFNPDFCGINHLNPDSEFVRGISGVLEHHPKGAFITNQDWMRKCVEQVQPGIARSVDFVVSDKFDYPFAFAHFTHRNDSVHGISSFLFGLDGPGDLDPYDSGNLDSYLRSRELLPNQAMRGTVQGIGYTSNSSKSPRS